MAWWPQVLGECGKDLKFFGYDVSRVVINDNRNKFRDNRNWRFDVADARVFKYPNADLFVCRQTLNHLWSKDATAVVKNLTRRAHRFVALTTNPFIEANPPDDVRTPLMPPHTDATCYTKLNLSLKPFRLPKAITSLQDVEGERLDIFML